MPSGQSYVGVRRRVVETASAGGDQPLREPSYGVLGRRADVGPLQPGPAVDVDLVGTVDQHVGDARLPQQRIQRPGADHLAAQRLVDREHGRVADRTAGAAQRLGDPVRRQLAG